jgi:hypothetical protein
MISQPLRERLEEFVCKHEACDDSHCIVKASQDWVGQMRERGFPEHELLLLALGFQCYLERERERRRVEAGVIRKSEPALPRPPAKVLRLAK